jgi:hypothetical protein
MSKKTVADFVPRQTIQTASGEVAINGYKYKVTFPRAGGKKAVNYLHDFGGHPLRRLLKRYILREAGAVAASTINQRCWAVKLLGQFFEVTSKTDLTPEVMKEFCHWLLEARDESGRRRFSDSVLPTYVNNVRAIYKSGLERGREGWTQQDLDLISLNVDKILRGCRERGAQTSVDKAIPLETYVSLIQAVGRELEQCRRVLAARDAGERESLYNLGARHMAIIDPNPYVVLSLLGALLHGMRAEELNTLKPGDLRIDETFGNHEVYFHAPNKEDNFMPANETFVEVWRLCEEWCKEARSLAGVEGGKLFPDCVLVYPKVNSHCSYPLMRLSSYYLNSSHLPYFFKKWFACEIPGEGGKTRPLLHAPDDPTRRLSVSFKKLRNAFGARFGEREKSRAAMARALRVRSPNTGERFYQHQARLDHAKRVHFALNAEAHGLAMRLKNPVAAGVSKETLRRAREAGAVTPQGLCGSALEGRSCERASDCLECPFLVVVASRKDRFIADRDSYVKRAEEAERKGDARGAENDLSRAKLCQAHIYRIEETFGGGGDERSTEK